MTDENKPIITNNNTYNEGINPSQTMNLATAPTLETGYLTASEKQKKIINSTN